MRKLGLAILIGITVLAFSGVGVSLAKMLIPASDKAKEVSKAPENSPVIDNGWGLERIDFIHYVRPDNPGKSSKAPSCYKLLGPKWKSLSVDYVINPTNPDGLPADFVASVISASAETWDDAVAAELLNDVYTINPDMNYGNQDFVNVISFGDYPDDRVIAVTSVWYIPRGKEIVEFDMLFNTRFNWGDTAATSSVMDLQNIATHELGHGLGLADIYDTVCSEVTMYGYSGYGETKKRSLEQPDINGLQRLYGF